MVGASRKGIGGAGELGRSEVDLAAKLLAKAASTEFDAEAIALVERSYGVLAKALTEYDETQSGPISATNRRERRMIRDRRKDRRKDSTQPREASQGAIDKYRRASAETSTTLGKSKNVLL